MPPGSHVTHWQPAALATVKWWYRTRDRDLTAVDSQYEPGQKGETAGYLYLTQLHSQTIPLATVTSSTS